MNIGGVMLAGRLVRELLSEGVLKRMSEALDREGYPFLRELLGACPRLRELLVSLLNPEVFDSNGFYRNLREDLKKAKNARVEIWSPFLNLFTIRDLGPDLRNCGAEEIVVRTRPLEDFKPERGPKQKHSPREWHQLCIDELKRFGAKVETSDKMHEKAVIIGDRVAYVGSANVLSRWDERTELMLRFEGPLVGELIRDLKPRIGGGEQ